MYDLIKCKIRLLFIKLISITCVSVASVYTCIINNIHKYTSLAIENICVPSHCYQQCCSFKMYISTHRKHPSACHVNSVAVNAMYDNYNGTCTSSLSNNTFKICRLFLSLHLHNDGQYHKLYWNRTYNEMNLSEHFYKKKNNAVSLNLSSMFWPVKVFGACTKMGEGALASDNVHRVLGPVSWSISTVRRN